MKELTVSRLGAEFAPRLVAIGIAALSLVLVIQGLRKAKLERDQETPMEKHEESGLDEAETPKGLRKYFSVLLTVLLIIGYIGLMPFLGFLLSSFFYLFIQICMLSPKNQRNYILFAGVSLIVSIFVYYVFKYLLNLMLPAGILG
jgi:putative tricarboxylic transport membrane protein